MSYNESLNPNSNYPPMTQSQWDSAPWSDPEVPEKDFDVTCCQTLSRTAAVTTNNYIPGAEGVDYEDGQAIGWHDDDDTSDTDWSEEYEKNGYHTPLQMLQILKGYLQKDLEKWEEENKKTPNSGPAFKVRKFKHLIEECDAWTEDETDFEMD